MLYKFNLDVPHAMPIPFYESTEGYYVDASGDFIICADEIDEYLYDSQANDWFYFEATTNNYMTDEQIDEALQKASQLFSS